MSQTKALLLMGLGLAWLAGCSINVADSTLSESAESYWLYTNNKNPKTLFSVDDEQVTLHVEFDYNLVASTQIFRANWIQPDGTPYVSGGVKTVFGNNSDLIVSLKVAGTTATSKPGTWRVQLFHEDRLLVERSFELQ
ncbi:MAG: hypothetical protein GKR94_11960 [Gammaproteobacteria bacterium]|nr:hypothetical protein [Gammaproteobacteria bacterium]